MIFTLILGLLIALVAVIFAIQNPEVVTVSFFTLEFSQPMAIILLITFGLGIIMLTLVSVPGLIKRRSTIASQKKDLGRHEKKIEALNLELAEAKVATEKVQAALFGVKEELKIAVDDAKKAREEADLAKKQTPPSIQPSAQEELIIQEPEPTLPAKDEERKDKTTGENSNVYKI